MPAARAAAKSGWQASRGRYQPSKARPRVTRLAGRLKRAARVVRVEETQGARTESSGEVEKVSWGCQAAIWLMGARAKMERMPEVRVAERAVGAVVVVSTSGLGPVMDED